MNSLAAIDGKGIFVFHDFFCLELVENVVWKIGEMIGHQRIMSGFFFFRGRIEITAKIGKLFIPLFSVFLHGFDLGGGEWCGVHDKEKLAYFGRPPSFFSFIFRCSGEQSN